MVLIKRYHDECGREPKMMDFMERISDDGLYDDHDGINTSFELSHPKPVLSIGYNIGEGGHMVELTIPGSCDIILAVMMMIMIMMFNVIRTGK